MKFTLDNKAVANGTVLVLGIRYERTLETDTRGRANPLVYTYAMLKAGGLWYVTGAGRVPQAAGWGAIEKWLERDGRTVEWVEVATGRERLWSKPTEAEAAVLPKIKVHDLRGTVD